jgi:Tfp pilus assembly protein PilF/dienelactone hydrolase
MTRRHPLRLAGALVACAAAADARAVETPRPHDITSYPVVYRVPAMQDVVEKHDVVYSQAGNRAVRLDLYYPSAPGPRRAWPAVVFANGVGDGGLGRLEDWEIYKTWARLVAAHGLVGITMEAEPSPKSGQNLKALVEFLARDGAALSVDAGRLAVWSCSGNVTTTLPYLMNDAPPGVKAAVIYYGIATLSSLRKDLPIFYVLAEKDSSGFTAGIRALWTRAIETVAPWRMVNAPGLPHAFDAVDESAQSKRLVKETLAFLAEHLAPTAPEPELPLAQRGLAYSYGQEWAKAEAAYGALAAKEPGSAILQRLLAWSRQQQGKSAEAVEGFRRAIAMGETGAVVHQQLATALLDAGRAAESVEAFRKAIALGAGGAFVQQNLAFALMRAGRTDEGVAILEGLIADGAAPGPVEYNIGCAFALAGRKDDALERLRRAIDAGYGTRAQFLADDDLASLRGDPRFEELLARLK